MFATSVQRWIYKRLAKPLFFRRDPEQVHERIVRLGKLMGRSALSQSLLKACFHFDDQALEQNILGIHFPNPVGLAAGFDKNADLMHVLPSVGFGFEEVGSITG